MDDDSKELMKIAAQTVLRPITNVVGDTIGVLGGDRLHAFRKANRAKWDEHYGEERAKIQKETETPDLRMAAEILGQVQDENRDELLKIWAKLMAAIVDEKRAPLCRREFVEIAKQLEPLDSRVLPMLASGAHLAPSRVENISSRLRVDQDQVRLAFRNLLRLQLVDQHPQGNDQGHPFVTPLGRQFLAALAVA
jgi:predicted transcriptional regulator